MRRFYIPFLLMPICVTGFSQAARSDDGVGAFQAVTHPLVAVSPFSGENPALGRYLSDALLADLAQSRYIRLIAGGENQRSQNEYSPDPRGDQQLRPSGRTSQADRLLVGSYLIRDKQIMLNAHLVDARSGRLVEGAGANVTGDANSLLTAVHRLAHLLHRKITGKDISFDGEGSDQSNAAAQSAAHQPILRGGSQASQYRTQEGSSAANSGAQSRAADAARNTDGYRSTDWGANAPSTPFYVAPPVVPVVVPYYQPIYYDYPGFYTNPYYYGYPYSYPYLSLSFSIRSRGTFFGTRSIGRFGGHVGSFGHVGAFGHVGIRRR